MLFQQNYEKWKKATSVSAADLAPSPYYQIKSANPVLRLKLILLGFTQLVIHDQSTVDSIQEYNARFSEWSDNHVSVEISSIDGRMLIVRYTTDLDEAAIRTLYNRIVMFFERDPLCPLDSHVRPARLPEKF